MIAVKTVKGQLVAVARLYPRAPTVPALVSMANPHETEAVTTMAAGVN